MGSFGGAAMVCTVCHARVGPAWSSMIVIGDRLFTQEQRGDQETVVSYAAAMGKELWEVDPDEASRADRVTSVLRDDVSEAECL